MSVTTYNRIKYLKEFISSWERTKSDKYKWTLIVSDDGSTDGTIKYLNKLKSKKYNLIIIKNNRKGVHFQTNAILKKSMEIGFDFGFKADDDIIFLNKNWDSLYMGAAKKYRYYHMVYYNTKWKKPAIPVVRKPLIEAFTTSEKCLGCLWTYTPAVIKRIGFFDYKEFGFRGNGHIDYTTRACRAGFNNDRALFDIKNSNSFIGMQSRSNYIGTMSSREMRKYSNKEEQKRRSKIINNPNRLYIPLEGM